MVLLGGQGLGNLDVVVDGILGGLGNEPRRLAQGIFLDVRDHVVRRGGDVDDQGRDAGQDGDGDGYGA